MQAIKIKQIMKKGERGFLRKAVNPADEAL